MTDYIPWIISAISLLFVILTFVRSGKKETKEDFKEEAQVMTGIRESLIKVNLKLDQVCTTTNEIRTDNKTMAKDIQGLDTRVSCVERDVKTAFKLIDEIKNTEVNK